MSKGPKTLVDGLADETLIEMAETFFGSRVEIERLTTELPELASELDKRLSPVRAASALLVRMLLDPTTAEAFLARLEVPAEPFLKLAEQEQGHGCQLFRKRFGMTLKSRWMKGVFDAYETLQREVDAYVHGRYEPDPQDMRRKRLSVNYRLVRGLVDSVNQSIERAREGERPSDVLRYMRSLDPLEQEKEKLTGAILEGYDQRIDETMAMKPVDGDALGLVAVPELPALDAVRDRLERFLASLYAQRRDEIRDLMAELNKLARHA